VKGLRDFILRGNLVELAGAFIMATAFAAVVGATVQIILDVIGKAGGTPNFSGYEPAGVSVGAFLTALITFVILAPVVYFLIVVPYTKARERLDLTPEQAGAPEDVVVLTEIRDLLAQAGPDTGTKTRAP
jgi:large conductance mechanosensitive channel